MKFYLGVTDNNWYNYLRTINPEDINFWQPSGTVKFKVLEQGAPFLLKLKSPVNMIGGIGFFASHSFLPLSIAWDTFRNRNGCETFDEFSSMILRYRKDKYNINPTVGCIVLTSPIFFKNEDWIEIPKNWSKNIVQGKSYTTNDAIGRELWAKVELITQKYFENNLISDRSVSIVDEESPQYGNSILQKVRIGQGAFRVLVTDAYNRRCSITGEKTLPVLEAAHIKSYSASGPNKVSNGMLLRSDIHKLYDNGYLTVTADYKIEVSSRIKAEFENGREYYRFHGKNLQFLPVKDIEKPNSQYIDWHNQNIYKG